MLIKERLKLPAIILYYDSYEFNKFPYMFLYKSLTGLAQVNQTWLSFIVGYVHYQMLKHLPPRSLEDIIPVPKPEKDHAEPTNYKPITLTSCYTILVWYLEFINLISPVQSGSRSERSTNDNLSRLETFIRDAFIKRNT